MAITVGEFRQFLSDSGNSMLDAGGGRILDRTMGAVMRRLSREGEWTWKRQRAVILLETLQDSTNATLVQGSPVVLLDSAEVGAFALEKRFYDEKWNVQVGGRETVYKLAEPPQDYEAKLESPFAGSSTPVTVPATFDRFRVSRTRYQLPERFSRLYGVELPQEGVNALSYLSRSDFEIYRRSLLTSASQSWVYTTYGNEEIEFWPPNGEGRPIECEVDFQAELRYPEVGADDSEVLDWLSQYEDLLWAAARVQLVIELGADAVQFDAQAAMSEYRHMLSIYKADDQGRGKRVWNLSGAREVSGTPRPFGLNLRGPVS